MCRNMVDIQSPTAEIRRGIKKKDRKKSQGKNIMSASATQGGHNKALMSTHSVMSNKTVNLYHDWTYHACAYYTTSGFCLAAVFATVRQLGLLQAGAVVQKRTLGTTEGRFWPNDTVRSITKRRQERQKTAKLAKKRRKRTKDDERSRKTLKYPQSINSYS